LVRTWEVACVLRIYGPVDRQPGSRIEKPISPLLIAASGF
jgi:hypothetical protein